MNELRDISTISQFIIIDDDHPTLFICKIIIQRTFKDMKVVDYDNPHLAINYFESDFTQHPITSVVLLDINMPEISGWEVLDRLLMLDNNIKKHITVVVMSSSIDPKDQQRCLNYPCVSSYLEKPLTLASLKGVTDKILKQHRSLNPF
jgi:CheY-like chemotaxis protein